MKGKLILVVGPSGSGKGALMMRLREEMPEAIFPVSCTTRMPRPGEKEGEMYYFVDEEEFDRKIQNGDFLEWAHYGGHRYGTLRSEILPALEEGKVVVREIEVQGAALIRKAIPPENIRSVFVDAGPWVDLEKRIRARAFIPEEELLKRKARYEEEYAYKPHADFVVANHDGELAQAQKKFIEAVRAAAAA